jgi:hypothetical protein
VNKLILNQIFSLIQADVNTQLIDHLIVHHTTDPKDSAYYLIEMTNFLTRLFQVNKFIQIFCCITLKC